MQLLSLHRFLKENRQQGMIPNRLERMLLNQPFHPRIYNIYRVFSPLHLQKKIRPQLFEHFFLLNRILSTCIIFEVSVKLGKVQFDPRSLPLLPLRIKIPFIMR
jgi:hypothetical protein